MLVASLVALQLSTCAGDAVDLRAVRAACAADEPTRVYLDGLIAAVAAYEQGGSRESLKPVQAAIARLEPLARTSVPAQIAGFVLRAAAAAAQSEREEMALYLQHAIEHETWQIEAGQPGAPGITAHEMAGELWMQVHRYADARAVYGVAAKRIGMTARIKAGLARVCARITCEPASRR